MFSPTYVTERRFKPARSNANIADHSNRQEDQGQNDGGFLKPYHSRPPSK